MSLSRVEAELWAQQESAVTRRVLSQSERTLEAYRVNPTLVLEHANIERATAQGGYGRRQIYELVQNGADALMGVPGGSIHVLATEKGLYCANEGAAVDANGVTALLSSHISLKRGNEIGRFGLGFKSVLGVTDRPEFYSRGGSFAFNAELSEEHIRRICPDSDRFPVLRIAEVVDPLAAAAADPVLAELMAWATTVVKLPRHMEDSLWLSEDMRDFPREFLLFSPHVGRLILEDRTAGLRRELQIHRHEHGQLRLVEGEKSSVWRVFSTNHSPSAEARKEAGDLADRETLPLIWAVPLEGRGGRGRFWAFFPTEYFTTLSGILNAPWKTNEDRQNLLAGTFNQELLEEAASLIVASLRQLADGSDPGRYLDLIPARGREAPNHADEYLSEAVYRLATDRPSIPDQTGQLQVPATMHLHPEGVSRHALQAWASAPSRPVDWAHSSVETRDRRPRVERLLAAVGRSASSLSVWLEQLVQERTPGASIAALRVINLVLDGLTVDQRQELERAPVVLTADGTFVAPRAGTVYLPGDYSISVPFTFVHRAVAAEPGALSVLERLGITPVDATQELEVLFRTAAGSWDDTKWELFWRLSRRVGSGALKAIANSREHEVCAKTVAGAFRPLHSVLLPGPIVADDGQSDASATIDVGFHAPDLEILSALGALPAPTVGRTIQGEPWFPEYCHYAFTSYLAALPPDHAQPQESKMEFERGTTEVGPLEVLRQLGEEGRARFTASIYQLDPAPSPWRLTHTTRTAVYPTTPVLAPHCWWVQREGRLRTSLGVRAVSGCVADTLRHWDKVLPVAQCPEGWVDVLGLPRTLEALDPASWIEAMERVDVLEDDESIGRFYGAAARFVAPPPTIRCRVGVAHKAESPSNITVVTTRRELEALMPQGAPTLLVPEVHDATILSERWGLRPAATAVQTQVYAVPLSAPLPLVDEFPGLRWVLNERQARLRLVRCSVLRLEILTESGKTAEDRTLHISDDGLYWCGSSDGELLRAIRHEFEIELSEGEIDQILADRVERARDAQVVRIRQEPTLEARMLSAVGARNIRRQLPAALLSAVQELHGRLDDASLARLALAVHGVDALHAFRNALDSNGLQPPVQWAGTTTARRFVRDLGFPPEFAGFEQAKREPLLEVEGPPLLPEMHDFQAVIAERVRALVRSPQANRALLSLPTGAGKTRVVVQALIEEMGDGHLKGPILWVAQSDELCEQAVQSWSYVWRGLGAHQPLNISRLWGGNEAVRPDSPMHVVVATIDKLQVCILKDDYGWLGRASCVVVDEAHESTEKSYSNLLEWQGLDRGRRGCPLIGLTATPYRGTSQDETMRLVHRYGNVRLDQDVLGDDPYRTLQEAGVLARVKHQVLDGSAIDLTDTELAQLRRTRLFPPSVEGRLGADTNRNRALLQSLLTLPADWTAILYAASVEHAETMAALLSLNGVPAASITGSTDPGARRHYVEQFRIGGVRVLTNYAVLTQGFDAPAVQAIYVARPTYSPNLYQQMIGRGLRGPRNMGTPECLIVNVQDNVRQFGEDFAFRQFEHLWAPHQTVR